MGLIYLVLWLPFLAQQIPSQQLRTIISGIIIVIDINLFGISLVGEGIPWNSYSFAVPVIATATVFKVHHIVFKNMKYHEIMIQDYLTTFNAGKL